MLTARPLHPKFGAEVLDLDPCAPLDAAQSAALRELFEEHSCIVLRGAVMNDRQQLKLSAHFGDPQVSFSGNLSGGTRLSRQSNVDPETGRIMPADHPRMRYQRANRQWHSDSSYRAGGSLCSILSAREVPPAGGDTEFASTAVAFAELPEELRVRVLGLSAEHSIAASQARTGEGVLSDAQHGEYPPVRQPLVLTNPRTGRRSLLIGAHAARICELDTETGRALLEELERRATVPENVYSHRWRAGDVVIWDNRCILHRATAYDSQRHRRWLERTTIPA